MRLLSHFIHSTETGSMIVDRLTISIIAHFPWEIFSRTFFGFKKWKVNTLASIYSWSGLALSKLVSSGMAHEWDTMTTWSIFESGSKKWLIKPKPLTICLPILIGFICIILVPSNVSEISLLICFSYGTDVDQPSSRLSCPSIRSWNCPGILSLRLKHLINKKTTKTFN